MIAKLYDVDESRRILKVAGIYLLYFEIYNDL